jgi:hypothetical protein
MVDPSLTNIGPSNLMNNRGLLERLVHLVYPQTKSIFSEESIMWLGGAKINPEVTRNMLSKAAWDAVSSTNSFIYAFTMKGAAELRAVTAATGLATIINRPTVFISTVLFAAGMYMWPGLPLFLAGTTGSAGVAMVTSLTYLKILKNLDLALAFALGDSEEVKKFQETREYLKDWELETDASIWGIIKPIFRELADVAFMRTVIGKWLGLPGNELPTNEQLDKLCEDMIGYSGAIAIRELLSKKDRSPKRRAAISTMILFALTNIFTTTVIRWSLNLNIAGVLKIGATVVALRNRSVLTQPTTWFPNFWPKKLVNVQVDDESSLNFNDLVRNGTANAYTSTAMTLIGGGAMEFPIQYARTEMGFEAAATLTNTWTWRVTSMLFQTVPYVNSVLQIYQAVVKGTRFRDIYNAMNERVRLPVGERTVTVSPTAFAWDNILVSPESGITFGASTSSKTAEQIAEDAASSLMSGKKRSYWQDKVVCVSVCVGSHAPNITIHQFETQDARDRITMSSKPNAVTKPFNINDPVMGLLFKHMLFNGNPINLGNVFDYKTGLNNAISCEVYGVGSISTNISGAPKEEANKFGLKNIEIMSTMSSDFRPQANAELRKIACFFVFVTAG